MCGYLSLKRYVFQMAIIYIMDNKLVDADRPIYIYTMMFLQRENDYAVLFHYFSGYI